MIVTITAIGPVIGWLQSFVIGFLVTLSLMLFVLKWPSNLTTTAILIYPGVSLVGAVSAWVCHFLTMRFIRR